MNLVFCAFTRCLGYSFEEVLGSAQSLFVIFFKFCTNRLANVGGETFFSASCLVGSQGIFGVQSCLNQPHNKSLPVFAGSLCGGSG